MMNINKKISLAKKEFLFLLRNIRKTLTIKKIPYFIEKEIQFYGFRLNDLKEVKKLYSELNNGKKIAFSKILFFSILGSRVLMIARHKEKIIGINMYYFNERDLIENTIHEGFIGVTATMRNMGIASAMRKLAKAHFSSNNVDGISTRISIANEPSLTSAKKNGFISREQYTDSTTGEIRTYMICDLRH